MIDEYISKKRALLIASGYCHPANIAKELAKLPSVRLSTESDDDIISRKALLKAIGERPALWVDTDEYALGARNQYDTMKSTIETLDSAQTDIVTCKDCKFSTMSVDGFCKYCKRLADDFDVTHALYLDGDFFCACAERKTDE